MATYLPAPADTSTVRLSDDLTARIETLAENVHENWYFLKMNDGWTFGQVYDPVLKTTPQLACYDDLTEEAKEYDRRIVSETLRYLVLLGFRIERTGQEHDAPHNTGDTHGHSS